MCAVEGAADETLVNAAGGAQEREGEHGEPEPPIENLLGYAMALQLEDVDRFLDPTGHCVDVYKENRFKTRGMAMRKEEESNDWFFCGQEPGPWRDMKWETVCRTVSSSLNAATDCVYKTVTAST